MTTETLKLKSRRPDPKVFQPRKSCFREILDFSCVDEGGPERDNDMFNVAVLGAKSNHGGP